LARAKPHRPPMDPAPHTTQRGTDTLIQRKGKERKGKERKGKERKGKERKGKEKKGRKERKGKEKDKGEFKPRKTSVVFDRFFFFLFMLYSH